MNSEILIKPKYIRTYIHIYIYAYIDEIHFTPQTIPLVALICP